MLGHHIVSQPHSHASRYPIIVLTNERIVLVVVGSITCVHWLALLWNIWITIWLGDYMVAYHELYADKEIIPIDFDICLETLRMRGFHDKCSSRLTPRNANSFNNKIIYNSITTLSIGIDI